MDKSAGRGVLKSPLSSFDLSCQNLGQAVSVQGLMNSALNTYSVPKRIWPVHVIECGFRTVHNFAKIFSWNMTQNIFDPKV